MTHRPGIRVAPGSSFCSSLFSNRQIGARDEARSRGAPAYAGGGLGVSLMSPKVLRCTKLMCAAIEAVLHQPESPRSFQAFVELVDAADSRQSCSSGHSGIGASGFVARRQPRHGRSAARQAKAVVPPVSFQAVRSRAAAAPATQAPAAVVGPTVIGGQNQRGVLVGTSALPSTPAFAQRRRAMGTAVDHGAVAAGGVLPRARCSRPTGVKGLGRATDRPSATRHGPDYQKRRRHGLAIGGGIGGISYSAGGGQLLGGTAPSRAHPPLRSPWSASNFANMRRIFEGPGRSVRQCAALRPVHPTAARSWSAGFEDRHVLSAAVDLAVET